MKLFQHTQSSRFLRLAGSALAFAALLALPVIAQQKGKGKGGDDDPDRAIKATGLPAGWSVRPDRGSPADVSVSQTGDVFHFVMSSAATFYNPTWTKTGNYKFSARLTQVKAPSHPTSYGLMFGGSNLAGPMQTYSYFLVRNQGDYYIANRDGDARPNTVVNWTVHPAIVKQGADGKQVNTLGVEVQGNNVIFRVNGTEVTRLEKSKVHADGMMAFRIGHNFDVDVDQVVR